MADTSFVFVFKFSAKKKKQYRFVVNSTVNVAKIKGCSIHHKNSTIHNKKHLTEKIYAMIRSENKTKGLILCLSLADL